MNTVLKPMFIEKDVFRRFLVDWEEHHTLSRDIVDVFDAVFTD
jgi:hypothetical protein